MSHIEKRRQLWYATLKVVSQQAQERLGKKKFLKSLGTGDKRKALELAKPLVAMWKAMIREAEGEPDAVRSEALRWREVLAVMRGTHEGEEVADAEMLVTTRAEAIEQARGDAAAVEFAQVALGTRTPSDSHYNEWLGSIVHLADKTQDQMKKDVKFLIAKFPTVEGMSSRAVDDWARELATRAKSPVSRASMKRMASFWSNYWKFLVKKGDAKKEASPFLKIELPVLTKRDAAKKGWVPFPKEDVPKLVAAAREKGDADLADLIVLGGHTGARIEELCALKVEHVGMNAFHIHDAKTVAGIRDVPIHAGLKPLVKRLKESSTDGYLLSGLTFNKYDDRSNAIGKRFGRLKAALGYSRQHVFHSLRKTLVTMLEDAGVSENLAADIVGHEKPRITYGLYSGGASLATKAAALAKVEYPGLVVM